MVARRELREGRAHPLSLLCRDEDSERVARGTSVASSGEGIETVGPASCAEDIRDHVPGDPSNEGAEAITGAETALTHGFYGASKRLLRNVVGGVGIAEGTQGHRFEPGSKALELLRSQFAKGPGQDCLRR